MRKILLVSFFVVFCLEVQGQSKYLEDFYTIYNGKGDANGGEYSYKADVSFRADAPGLGDIRMQCSISSYQIEGLVYKGKLHSYGRGVEGMPIVITNGQFDVAATAKFNNTTISGDLGVYISFTISGVRKGAMDYYYLSKEEVKEITNTLGLKTSSDLNNLRITITHCELKKTYFEELSEFINQIKEEEKMAETSTSSSKTSTSSSVSKNQNNKENEIREDVTNEDDNGGHDNDESDDDERDYEAEKAMHDALKKTNYYNYVYSGIDQDAAYRMVQDDINRELHYKEMESSLNALGSSVYSLFENRANRKEAERASERVRKKAYKDELNAKIARISKANSKFRTDLMQEIDANYPLSSNVEQMKMRIRAIIYGYDNYIYPRNFRGRYDPHLDQIASMVEGRPVTGSREDVRGYAQLKINKVWFKGEVLNIDVSEEMVETEADVTYAPHKYMVRSLIAYNVVTNTSDIKRRIIWANETALPQSGWLNNSDFNDHLQRINDPKYIIPDKIKFSKTDMEGLAFAYDAKASIPPLEKAMQLNWRRKQLAKPDFINHYAETLKNDLDYFKGSKYEPIPYVFFNDELKSSNPNEIRVLYLLKDNKYLIFSFPEKEKLDILVEPTLWTTRREDHDKSVEYYSFGTQKFRPSKENADVYIGGESGEDLLIPNNSSNSKKIALYTNYRDGLLLKQIGYRQESDRSNWSPKIEIGTYSLHYDKDISIDPELQNKLNEFGAKASSSSYHLGLKILFHSERSGYLNPIKLNDYTYAQQKINRGGFADLYYYKLNNSSSNSNALNLYESYRIYGEVPFSNLKQYKELSHLYSSYYSFELMNTYYLSLKKFEVGREKFQEVSNKGTINTLLGIMKELSQFDYALTSIENEGRIKYYHEDGSVKALGLLVNNKKYGEWEEYHDNGTVKTRINYRRNELHGKYDEYDDKGRLKISKNYYYGGIEGEYFSYVYYNDEFHKKFSHNVDGIKHGTTTTYRNHVRFATQDYNEGLPEEYITFYYPNGNIKSRGEYINSKFQGHVQLYREDGTLKEEGECINNNKVGQWKVFDHQGKYLKIRNYDNN
ncbi:toxin-antitoxin system YwqK family antitoxin [Saccharicrinis fermentans]|uniref:MORN repeat variant n=1 Tax=Saccharicrinis fermentans DSM 9555 = JCM 21142 TaxID=869213 RepID=W7YKK4_9BACT|nr:hypothetical protein [Saccharicrinis fermentans]GAF02894.1 MORN repeat variant [Saccharicrinis fermentans DSM 9555 = JCM 21142]